MYIQKDHNTAKKEVSEKTENAIGKNVIQCTLLVISDFTWTGWELASQTTIFQEKGLKSMNKCQ